MGSDTEQVAETDDHHEEDEQVNFGSGKPVTVWCIKCHKKCKTVVETKIGVGACLDCGGLWLMHCVLGCCLIPFCMETFKVHTHYCGNCKALVAKQGGVGSLDKEMEALAKMNKAIAAMDN